MRVFIAPLLLICFANLGLTECGGWFGFDFQSSRSLDDIVFPIHRWNYEDLNVTHRLQGPRPRLTDILQNLWDAAHRKCSNDLTADDDVRLIFTISSVFS